MCQKVHRTPYVYFYLILENAESTDVCKELRIHVEGKTPRYKLEH